MSETPFREPGRRTPAKGVHVSLGGPNWVFLTVGTENRERWLAQTSVQRALHDIWQNTATAWLVIRELGGAIYGDRRYNRVFIGHNGAESYYASRGFRASLKV
jgi:hypothetical protein